MTAIKKVKKIVPKSTESAPDKEYHPILALREEVDELFDRFFSNVSFGKFGKGLAEIEPLRHLEDSFINFGKMAPRADVSETDTAYKVVTELPGMSEDDIEISFGDGILSITGEKTEEKKEEKENFHLSERRYGSVKRVFSIPVGIKTDKITASFNNGVLDIEMPKLPKTETEDIRKIKIGK